MIRVLVADDHPVVRSGLVGVLTSLGGFDVVAVAADGREAVREAVLHQPDVALMDICLPDGDGFQVMDYLHALTVTARLPVIFISASSLPGIAERLREFGGAEFLQKPFEAKDLEAAIGRVTSARQAVASRPN